MNVDRRTLIIVAIIVAVTLPIIVFVFRKSFFPIIASIGHTLESAAVLNSGTGLPGQFLPNNVREAIGK
jgi:hypothetical protein